MAFAFKRTIPAQQVSVSLTPREWEVVRKCLSAYTDSELPAFEQAIAAAAEGAPWLQDADEWKQFVHAGTSEVEVKVGDEVLYDGEWLQVVALSRNGEEAVVDRGDGGVYVLAQDDVEGHRPAQRNEAPQPVPAPYVPKVGDRVRATSTRNNVPQEVVGKVGVVSELSKSGRIGVRYEGRVAGRPVWWLKDFEPSQIVGKEYVHGEHGRCTLTRNDGDAVPRVRIHSNGQSRCLTDYTLTPA